jgi:hypothetical protein
MVVSKLNKGVNLMVEYSVYTGIVGGSIPPPPNTGA